MANQLPVTSQHRQLGGTSNLKFPLGATFTPLTLLAKNGSCFDISTISSNLVPQSGKSSPNFYKLKSMKDFWTK